MRPNKLEFLRSAIEHKVGFKPEIHSEFIDLYHAINRVVSENTLKRIWGYSKDHTSISLNSINILSRFLGYSSYDEFMRCYAFQNEDSKLLFQASKLAKLAKTIYSERYETAYDLLLQCEYEKALTCLQRECSEVEDALQTATTFIESSKALISETYLRAQITWTCQHNEEKIIERIDSIYESILPLAISLNDHYSLYMIYENWAYMNFNVGKIEYAFELCECAIHQARILQIEYPDTYPQPLVSSNNTLALFLIEVGEYKDALELIEDMLQYEGDVIMEGYLQLNYCKAAIESDIGLDFCKIYFNVLEKIDLWHKENEPINESIHLQAILHYNLGVMYEEILSTPDYTKAIQHYEYAIDYFESRFIPTKAHQFYHNSTRERLEKLLGE